MVASQEELVRDIADSKKQYLFSDGIGLMTSTLAESVSTKIRLKGKSRVPSAFQIRYGGAKGMLAVWDHSLLRRRPGIEISLRPSMRKFESNHRVLEIVGYSKRLPAFLNRQIILLLSGVGVPDKPFQEIQANFLQKLDIAMRENGAEAALHLLYSSGHGFMQDEKLKSVGAIGNMGAFFRAGLTCVSCEHLFNSMNAFRQRMIRDVKNRARIPLDSKKGVCAIGVLDELGILNPGEIFCQYRDPQSGKRRIVKGKVTVGRSPCHHPGDIQPVQAVDHDKLRHMVDVIVFPQKGDRPLPSMLSGGDLDGDIFFCIFDKRISYPPILPYAAMNYEAPAPKQLDRDVQTSDVADFFVEYMRNDKLGVIANAYLAHADREERGIFSSKCMALAGLHSTAVDFAKTGIPATFPRELSPLNERGQYPDFMGKHRNISYKSEKVLGKLFRACNVISNDQDNNFASFPNPSSARVDNMLDALADDGRYGEQAHTYCVAYNFEIKRLMDKYGVQSEGEIVSGQVLSFTARHAQIRGRRDHMPLTMRMNRETNELRYRFREEFFEGLGEREGGKYSVDTIIKACTWHRACRKQANICQKSDDMVFLSFPWVVSDVLLTVIRNIQNRDI